MFEYQINTGYASFQLHRSLVASSESKDVETRERAAIKAKKWQSAIEGIVSGSIKVGSRTPVKDTPAWVTLEVLTGGFATGQFSAGGDLLPFERQLISKICPDRDRAKGLKVDRAHLNSYFISESGFEELLDRLQSGNYQVNVPEEGALLTAAWLTKNGFQEEARELIEKLSPWFSKIRFYPQPAETPVVATNKVFLRDAKSVAEDLSKVKTPLSILTQREAILVWQPFWEKVVSFLLSVCNDSGSTQSVDEDSEEFPKAYLPALNAETHLDSVQALIKEYRSLRSENIRCRKPRRKDNLAQTIAIFDQFVQKGKLPESSQMRLGVLCARYVNKRGLPTSARHEEFRNQQRRQVEFPLFVDVAKILLERLSVYGETSGVEDFDTVSKDISSEEANEVVPQGTPLPKSLFRKLERCRMDLVEVLVDKRIIKSGDSLAIVLPQITGNLLASDIQDGSLQALFSSIYRAFRRRRSLLLLNYESQVKIEELPWVQSIDSFRSKKGASERAALESAREIARLSISNFPYAIIPNKLLQEFRAISKAADLSLPFVDEVAADIFMGGFGAKFVQASHIAAKVLKGTLYETYYKIDFEEILSIDLVDVRSRKSNHWSGINVCKEFGNICKCMAVKGSAGSFVAKNGTVIEQQQILTTQNLATIVSGFQLEDELRSEYSRLAESCFQWICNQLQVKDKNFHSRLVKVKNSAYAWRQMVFFLSLTTEEERSQFLSWARSYLLKQDPEFFRKLLKSVNGLEKADIVNRNGKRMPKTFRPFLGWSVGGHFLLT